MHASTIAAILAFTAGMSVNAAPVVGPQVISNTQPTGLHTILDNVEVDHKVSELAKDGFTAQLLTTRDPEARVPIGKIGSGVAGGIGAISGGLTIHQILGGQKAPAPAKREAEAEARVPIGKIGSGVAGGIGAISGGLGIHQFITGQKAPAPAKREAEAEARVPIGKIGSGVAGGIGAISGGL
ncbi:hypothetical protein PTT_06472, partial [Pyrenophora teres f. teres 0-1]